MGERQIDRQTDRQRHRERETDRQTETDRQRQTDRQSQRCGMNFGRDLDFRSFHTQPLPMMDCYKHTEN